MFAFSCRFRADTRSRNAITNADEYRPVVPVTRQRAEMLASAVLQRATATAQNADDVRIRTAVASGS
jgi:hypothetical protein